MSRLEFLKLVGVVEQIEKAASQKNERESDVKQGRIAYSWQTKRMLQRRPQLEHTGAILEEAVKARYSFKFGGTSQRLDKLLGTLSQNESDAVWNFLKTKDQRMLCIPLDGV